MSAENSPAHQQQDLNNPGSEPWEADKLAFSDVDHFTAAASKRMRTIAGDDPALLATLRRCTLEIAQHEFAIPVLPDLVDDAVARLGLQPPGEAHAGPGPAASPVPLAGGAGSARARPAGAGSTVARVEEAKSEENKSVGPKFKRASQNNGPVALARPQPPTAPQTKAPQPTAPQAPAQRPEPSAEALDIPPIERPSRVDAARAVASEAADGGRVGHRRRLITPLVTLVAGIAVIAAGAVAYLAVEWGVPEKLIPAMPGSSNSAGETGSTGEPSAAEPLVAPAGEGDDAAPTAAPEAAQRPVGPDTGPSTIPAAPAGERIGSDEETSARAEPSVAGVTGPSDTPQLAETDSGLAPAASDAAGPAEGATAAAVVTDAGSPTVGEPTDEAATTPGSQRPQQVATTDTTASATTDGITAPDRRTERSAAALPQERPAPAAPQGGTATAKDAGAADATAGAPTLAKADTQAVPAPPSAATAPPGPDVAVLLERGDRFLDLGDVASARLFYRRAADGGSAKGAMLMGMTFDPVYFAQAGIRGTHPSAPDAAQWYGRAMEMGMGPAQGRMETLRTWLEKAASAGDDEAKAALQQLP